MPVPVTVVATRVCVSTATTVQSAMSILWSWLILTTRRKNKCRSSQKKKTFSRTSESPGVRKSRPSTRQRKGKRERSSLRTTLTVCATAIFNMHLITIPRFCMNLSRQIIPKQIQFMIILSKEKLELTVSTNSSKPISLSVAAPLMGTNSTQFRR